MLKLIAISVVFISLISCKNEPKSNAQQTEFDKSFLWNFTEIKDSRYSYEMTSIDEETFAKDTESQTIKTEIIGDLVVSSRGDRTAALLISNAEKTIFSHTDKGEWSPANPLALGESFVGELNQNSMFHEDRLDAIWNAYLPLPLDEITEGESYKLTMNLPVGIESFKYVNGFNTLTFKGYKTIQNRKCIVLEGNIDVAEVDDLDFKGKYEHSMKGKGTYYFDAKEHIFVQADVEITVDRQVESADEKAGLYINRNITEKFSLLLKSDD